MDPLISTIIPQSGWEKSEQQIGLILTTEFLKQKQLGAFSEDMPEIFIERSVPADSDDDIYINILVAGGQYGSMTQQTAQGIITYWLDFFSTGEETALQNGSSISTQRLQKFVRMAMYVFRAPYYRTLAFPLGLIGGVYVEQFQMLDPHQKEDLDFTRFGRVQLTVRMAEDTESWQGVELFGVDSTVKLDLTEKGYKFVYEINP